MARLASLVIAIATLAVLSLAPTAASGADDAPRQIVGDGTFPVEWLDETITVAEAERRHPGMPDDSRAERFPEIRKPFGFLSAKWEAIKTQMQPGDELWTFASSAESWRHLAGRSGIALVRDKKVIASFVTRMN